jgi:hypothetical protein
MKGLEDHYLESHPEDTNDEISFVDFDVKFRLDTDQAVKESFKRIISYFGGFDRAKRIFDFNGVAFPPVYPKEMQ